MTRKQYYSQKDTIVIKGKVLPKADVHRMVKAFSRATQKSNTLLNEEKINVRTLGAIIKTTD